MPTTLRDRDRTEDIRALEELWDAPAAADPDEGLPPSAPAPARASRWALPLVPGMVLVGGWIAFFTIALTLEPAPEPGATPAGWAVAVWTANLVLLLGAAGLGPIFSRFGFGAAAVAGAFAMAGSVSCRATEHHLGNWWLLELGATAALTGLAVVGLVQRLRR
jgi:hypothetical protein